MRKTFVLLFLIGTFLSSYSDTPKDLKVTRENGVAFLTDGIHFAEIDSSSVIAQYKKGTEHSSFIKNSTPLYDNIIRLTTPKDMRVEDFFDLLLDSGDFDDINYNFVGSFSMYPNDTYVGSQWYLGAINGYSAWDITTGDPSIKIGTLAKVRVLWPTA